MSIYGSPPGGLMVPLGSARSQFATDGFARGAI